MATTDHDLDELLGAPPPADAHAPRLIPWGWQAFLLAVAVVDVLCFVAGYVPWSGGRQGLHRGDVVAAAVLGLALGGALGLLLTWAAARRAERLGVTAEEAALAADELPFASGAQRMTDIAGSLGLAALLIVVGALSAAVFTGARHWAAFALASLNGIAGMVVPFLWHRFPRANAAFYVWLDERNAPFDREAAARAAAHRARLAEIRDRIEAGEKARRARLDRLPRVPPPWYVSPTVVWAPLALAALLDILLLFSPGLAHMGAGRVVWRMIVHWVWGAIGTGLLWGLLSWNYVEVGDQVSRRWSARDWSAGISAIILEVALGLIGLALLVGLFGDWALRLACWNLIAPTFLLTWLLRDIRRTAREHYGRSAVKGLAEPAAVAEDEEEV